MGTPFSRNRPKPLKVNLWDTLHHIPSVNSKVKSIESREDGKMQVKKRGCKPYDQIDNVTAHFFTNKNYPPTSFNSNLHNEINAVRGRILKKTPDVDSDFMKGFVDFVKSYRRILFRGKIRRVKPVGFDEYLRRSNASPEVKRTLKTVNDDLISKGITCYSKLGKQKLHRWTTRKAFVKVENLLYTSELGVLDKDPRLIQGATAEFICLVGPFFMALQDRMKKIFNSSHCIWFTSGADSRSTASWLNEPPGWRVKLDDISAFDGSYSSQLLELEHEVSTWFGMPRATSDLMHANIDTHGITTHGVLYSRKGMRKSGDPYTSLWNSIMNGLMKFYCFFKSNPSVDIKDLMKLTRTLVQGDDSLTTYHPSLKFDLSYMRRLGFKCDDVDLPNLDRADFCSCWCYRDSLGRVFAPKIGRVLAKFGYYVNYPRREHPLSVLRGTAIGLKSFVGDLPILSVFLDRVLELTSGYKEYHTPFNEEWKMCFRPVKTNLETYFHLGEIYGLTPEMIEDMESDIKLMQLDSTWSSVRYSVLLFDRDTSGPSSIFAPLN
jgi:hypothetical protein